MKPLLDFLIWLDIQLFRLITLGRYPVGETASAAAWRMKLAGRRRGRVAVWLIDGLFRPWQTNHCQNAYLWQIEIYQKD
jgi:hypothetical protein